MRLMVVLQVVPVFHWSRKCTKMARGELTTFGFFSPYILNGRLFQTSIQEKNAIDAIGCRLK